MTCPITYGGHNNEKINSRKIMGKFDDGAVTMYVTHSLTEEFNGLVSHRAKLVRKLQAHKNCVSSKVLHQVVI